MAEEHLLVERTDEAPDDPELRWVARVAAAVWIVDRAGAIRYLNRQAESLLGVDRSRGLGAPCSEVIAGLDEHGETLCRACCRLREDAARGEPLSPFVMQRQRRDQRGEWLLVVPISVDSSTDRWQWLLHLAVDVSRAGRIRAHLEHVLGAGAFSSRLRRSFEDLTPRQHEVLAHLVDGDGVKQIARQLSLSHATARNHVQNILRALGVHSIREAIALSLLYSDDS